MLLIRGNLENRYTALMATPNEAKDLDAQIGLHIRERRDRLDWSQKTLAEKISDQGFKMNPQVIYNIEGGQRALKFSEAHIFANVLGVPVEDLLPVKRQNVINRNWMRAAEASTDFAESASMLIQALDRLEHDLTHSVQERENMFGVRGEDLADSYRAGLEKSPAAIVERVLLMAVVEENQFGDLQELYESERTAAEVLSEVVAERVAADESLKARWWYQDLLTLASFAEAVNRRGECDASSS